MRIKIFQTLFSDGWRNGVDQDEEKTESEKVSVKWLCAPEIESCMEKADEFIKAKEYEAAIEQLREAIRTCPTSAVAHNHLGCAMAYLQRFDDAEKEFLDALDLSVSDPYAPHPYREALGNLGRLRGQTGKFKFRDDLQDLRKATRRK